MTVATWPEPAWIAALPEADRETAKVRFYLNMAAAYYSESGSITALSRALGKSSTAINMARTRGRVSPELAILLEVTLGRERFPRELFNSIFLIGA